MALWPATFLRATALNVDPQPTSEERIMFVSDILAEKGGLVYTVSPGTTVSQISRQLSTRRIGSVLVVDRLDRVAGIVSERDIVNAIAAHGAPALELDASEVMTRHVVTCDPDDSIDHVVKARIAETEHETEALRAYIVAG